MIRNKIGISQKLRYQIFVSSTYEDLINERNDTIKTIIRLNHFPASMEGFNASDKNQFEYIKRVIDDSDYLVLIVGNNYGAAAEDGTSYTEKEFDYAVARGIPILAFVQSNFNAGAKQDVSVTREWRLNRFIEKVSTNRVAPRWKTREELSGLIPTALSQAFEDAPQQGYLRGSQTRGSSLITRDEVDPIVGSLEQRINAAKTEIRISGSDCKSATESLSGHLARALDRGVKLKVMCLDPRIADNVALVDDRFKTAESFVNSVASVESAMRDIGQNNPLFEMRYSPILTSVGFFISDPGTPTGTFKIELHSIKPYKPVHTRPHMLLDETSGMWVEYFTEQWESYWNLARKAF